MKFFYHSFFCSLILFVFIACSPRVAVEIPDKPIQININAKIEHEVRIKVERDVSDLVKNNNDLF